MPGYTLVPVDYQPVFGDYSLVPVDYDPFAEDGVTQQARTQLASHPQGFDQPPSVPQPPGQDLHSQYQALRPMLGDRNAMLATMYPEVRQALIAQALAGRQQPGQTSEPAPTGGISGLIGAKIAELAGDFYNQSILKPARDLRDMGHDLVTDPAYFLHAIGPSLVGLGMSAPTAQVGSAGRAEGAQGVTAVAQGVGLGRTLAGKRAGTCRGESRNTL